MNALTDCPVCRRQVSTAAHACPGCGHPLAAGEASSRPQASDTGRTIGKVATVAGVAYIVPWLARLVVAIVTILVFGYFIFR